MYVAREILSHVCNVIGLHAAKPVTVQPLHALTVVSDLLPTVTSLFE